MWLLGQSWLDLLFAHWPVEREQLKPHVPPPLELETFDGQTYAGFSPKHLGGGCPAALLKNARIASPGFFLLCGGMYVVGSASQLEVG
jgi:uncharacterized protein YqjF (DUF2071 family)